jgi:hypothetical protein
MASCPRWNDRQNDQGHQQAGTDAELVCLARWGWQASNLRPDGYEPPALTD